MTRIDCLDPDVAMFLLMRQFLLVAVDDFPVFPVVADEWA